MGLADDIANDTTGVFLNTGDFADTVNRYPKGDRGNSEEVTCIIVPDAAEGTRELSGDGRTIHGDNYSALRESLLLLVDDAQEINEPTGDGADADIFEVLDSEYAGLYTVKRVTGGDTRGMKDVLIVRPQKRLTRQPRREG